jgi:hypothetical protein
MRYRNFRSMLKAISLIALAALLALVAAQPGGSALAHPAGSLAFLSPPPPPTVWIGMNDLVLAPGTTGVTDIMVGNVNLLYGVDFKLQWTPTCLQVVGTKIDLGPVFPSGSTFVAQNVVDNNAGEVYFGASLIKPAPAFSGTGVIARITWKATCAAVTTLNFASVKMSTSNGQPVDPAPTALPGTVTSTTVMPISGQVLLQGRTDHSGTSVFVSEVPCPAVNLTSIGVSSLPYTYTLTDAAGNFALTLDSYRSYQCLTAFKQNYLSAQKKMPVGALGSITLPGGDVNQDNCINIFDLTMIGSRYGSNDPRGDVNGDGMVDIFDLTIAANNYGKCGPVTW